MTVSLSLCESFSSLGAPRAAPPRFRTLTTLSHYCARHPPPSVPTQASAQTSLYLHHSIYLTPELRFIVVTLQNPESIELVGIGDNLSRQSLPWARANDKVARVNGHVQEAASERERERGRVLKGSWRMGPKRGASPLLHYSKLESCPNQSWHICLMPTVNRIKAGLICLMLIVLQFLHMSTLFNKELLYNCPFQAAVVSMCTALVRLVWALMF